MRSALILALALVVGACATEAQREAGRMSEAGQAALDSAKQCMARYTASADYQSLKDKLPPLSEPAPMSLLANHERPSTAEAETLIRVHREYVTPCRQIIVEGMNRMHPGIGGAYASNYAAADAEYVKLVRREISWGDYALARERESAALQQRVAAIDAAVKKDLTQSHEAELQRRQASAAAMAQWSYQQQVIAALNRPAPVRTTPTMATTNCTRLGAFLDCTTTAY
jgi:hypothetical protein